MRTKTRRSGLFFTILVFGLLSCESQLLPRPTGTRVQTARSAAPEHFVASHGRQKIHLSWSATAGAQGYRIYASERLTPTEDSFVQVTYVPASDSPFADIDVRPGSEAWYRVSAILSNGTETVPGESVLATSLAEPEITQIETDSEDATKLTVYWNMSNCRNDTYRRQTSYTITCTSSIDTVTKSVNAVDLTETKYTVSGLSAHTTYKVKVCARTELGDEAESPELTAETLHQLQPGAVLSLTGSYGTSAGGITLNFTLPEKADMQRKDDGTFEKAPLVFKVYRKASADSDTAWEPVNSGNTIALTDSEGTAITAANYPEEGGTSVYWTDTTAPLRGVRYDYKVQSYINLASFKSEHGITDDAALRRTYNYMETASNSNAVTFGWRMKEPALSTKNYTPLTDEENTETYVSAGMGLSFVWNNFLLDSDLQNANLADGYKFLLYEHMTPFSCDSKAETTQLVKTFTSIASVNEYTKNFDLTGGTSGDRGMYTYTLYIVNADASVPEEGSTETPAQYLDRVTTTPPLAVSDNAGSIEDFTVLGGYSDKFIVSWKKENGYNYSLTYSQTVDGVLTDSDVELNISTATDSGDIRTFTDTIVQPPAKGVVRTYRLTAVTSSGSAPVSSTSEPQASLGTPEPEFDSAHPAYDTITITWDSVQAAASYAIQLGNETLIDLVTEGENANAETFTDSLGTERYSYTFSAEQLGNRISDASKAGLPNAITVTALSEREGEATYKTVQARTLGPATVSLDPGVAQAYRSITVRWNAVDGANAYQLLRKRWTSDGEGGWISDEDQWESFIIDAETNTVSTNGEAYASMAVTQTEGRFVLTDSYTEIPAADKETASQMAITQSRIPWGIPVEYLVVPLRSDDDSFNGTQLSSPSLTTEGHKLSYSGIASFAKKGSAVGYGLNVHADKAEDHEKVTVTWNKPYSESVTIVPRLYRRVSGSSAAFTQVNEQLISTSVSVDHICTSQNELTQSYEYAVKYNVSSTDTNSSLFTQSYVDNLKETTEQNGEQCNAGYPFYLDNFTVGNVRADGYEGFTESVDFSSPWNYTNRVNGPEDDGDTPAYTIWTKNKNNSTQWFQIASMTTAGEVSLIDDPGWYATTITAGPASVTLTPTGVTNATGTNNGLLKVQRDYKHYYMIQAQRKNSEGKIIYTYIGLDESVWTYRRISAEEFAKNVLLIIADAVNQCGITEGDRTTDGNGGNGLFKTNRYTTNTGFMYGTENTSYIHTFHGLPGTSEDTDFASDYTLKFPMTERLYGVIMYSPYYFPESKIQVTHASKLKSYQGQLNFTAGKKIGMWTTSSSKDYSLTADVTLSSGTKQTVSVSNTQSKFESTFPISLGTDLHDRVSKKSDDSDRLQFNGIWWTVRTGGTEPTAFKYTEAE